MPHVTAKRQHLQNSDQTNKTDELQRQAHAHLESNSIINH